MAFSDLFNKFQQDPNSFISGIAGNKNLMGSPRPQPAPVQPTNFLQRLSAITSSIQNNPVYKGATRIADSINNSPDNPVGTFFNTLKKTKDPMAAVRATNKSAGKLVYDNTVQPAAQAVGKIAAQTGNPINIPLPGVGKQQSFTQDVQNAKGAGNKALTIAGDVGDVATLIPGGLAVKKGIEVGAPAVKDASKALGEVGAVGKNVKGAGLSPEDEFKTLKGQIKGGAGTPEQQARYSQLKDQLAVASGKRSAPNPDKFVSSKPIEMPTSVYRGETAAGGKGTAQYGQGLYTTTSRAEAAKYGAVTKLDSTALPNNPLQFRTELDFKQWENEMARSRGVDKRQLYGVNGGVEQLTKQLGHDGITIGSGNDMVIVKHADSTPQGLDLMKAMGSKNPEADVAAAQKAPLIENMKQGNQKAIDSNVATHGEVSGKKLQLPTNPDQEGRIAKATLSKGTLIERQSPEAASLMNKQIKNQAQYSAQLKDTAAPFMKLSNKDAEAVVAAKEQGAGLKGLTDVKQSEALQALHDTLKPVSARAAKAGTLVGDQGDTYFPQMIDWNKMPKGSAAYNKSLEDMVNHGYANDIADAVDKLDNFKKADLVARRAGNLEFARRVNLPSAVQLPAKQRLAAYIEQASRRVTQAEHFGASNQKLKALVGDAARKGKDAQTLNKAIDLTLNPARADSKLLRGTREVLAASQLKAAAISHVFQTINNTMDAGYAKTLAGWVKSLSGDNRALVKASGALEDVHGINKQTGLEGLLSKTIAPALRRVMVANRNATALTGRMYANGLAAKGGAKQIARLRELGVEGSIGDKLTAKQTLDAMHGYTAEKMFRATPMDTPLWAESNAGKMIGQYRLAYGYKQTGLLYDKVLKEAAKGNVVPLLRMAAIMPLAGEGILAGKSLISGSSRQDTDNIWHRLADDVNAGGLGLPGEAINAYNYGRGSVGAAVQEVAGLIAPAAGTGVQAIQKIQQAMNGNSKPLKRMAVGLIPLIGSRLSHMMYPPASKEAITYAKTITKLQNGPLLKDPKDRAAFDYLTSKGAKGIDENGVKGNLYIDRPNVKEALKELDDKTNNGNPNPYYQLSVEQQQKLDTFNANQIARATGQDYNKQGQTLNQVLGDGKAGLTDQAWYQAYEAQLQDWAAKLPAGSGAAANNAEPLSASVKSSLSTQELMNQYDSLTSSHDKFVFSLQHPEIQSLFNSETDKVNSNRGAMGMTANPSSVQITPALRQKLLQYEALPTGTGAKTKFANANPDVKAYFDAISKASGGSGSNTGGSGSSAYNRGSRGGSFSAGRRAGYAQAKVYSLIGKEERTPRRGPNVSHLGNLKGHKPSMTPVKKTSKSFKLPTGPNYKTASKGEVKLKSLTLRKH